MNHDYLAERRNVNDDLARIARMITACHDAEQALRLLHDERRAIGGGSRAYIGDLLSAAESRLAIVSDGVQHFALEYVVKTR